MTAGYGSSQRVPADHREKAQEFFVGCRSFPCVRKLAHNLNVTAQIAEVTVDPVRRGTQRAVTSLFVHDHAQARQLADAVLLPEQLKDILVKLFLLHVRDFVFNLAPLDLPIGAPHGGHDR